MTIHNTVECDACGATVKPPENHRWLVLLEVGPDGVTASNCDGHLCYECRKDNRHWIQQRREHFEQQRRNAAAAGQRKN